MFVSVWKVHSLLWESINQNYINWPCWNRTMHILYFVNRVGVFLEHMHKLKKLLLYAWLTPDFLLFFSILPAFLIFSLLLQQVPQLLKSSLRHLNRSQASFKISHHDRTSPGSSQKAVFVIRMPVFANTILKHCLQAIFMKTICKLRTGLTLT